MMLMNKVFVVGLLAVAPIWAFAHGSDGPSSGHGPGMMMSPQQMEQMHQNWLRMDNMMRQVPEAGSQEERARLMEEHREAMREQMDLMHGGMMGPGMMGGGHGMMDGNHGQGMMNSQSGGGNRSSKSEGSNVDQRLRRMEDRMNQMQLMMEQMLRHEQQQHQD